MYHICRNCEGKIVICTRLTLTNSLTHYPQRKIQQNEIKPVQSMYLLQIQITLIHIGQICLNIYKKMNALCVVPYRLAAFQHRIKIQIKVNKLHIKFQVEFEQSKNAHHNFHNPFKNSFCLKFFFYRFKKCYSFAYRMICDHSRRKFNEKQNPHPCRSSFYNGVFFSRQINVQLERISR